MKNICYIGKAFGKAELKALQLLVTFYEIMWSRSSWIRLASVLWRGRRGSLA